MVDEVLYQARIHPQEIASSMSEESCNTLLKSINEVTGSAIEVDADVSRFPVLWLFYLRWGKKLGNLDVVWISTFQQGFQLVGYGCTTCIGNSGDLVESVTSAVSDNDLVDVVVLSGNRNFEGRVHPLTRAKFLASPPMVVAYALAGTVDIDFEKEPIGTGKNGKTVYFRDIWPSNEKIAEVVQSSVLPDMVKSTYEAITQGNPFWNNLSVASSNLYSWDPSSTYIHQPPYFKGMTMDPPGPRPVKEAYCLLNFGDSITTDHISPAGSIHKKLNAIDF